MPEELKPFPAKGEKIFGVYDWDNIWISLYKHFGIPEMEVERRIQAVIDWGSALGGTWDNVVFVTERLSDQHRKIFDKHGFETVMCNKKLLPEPVFNVKKDRMENIQDTVDQRLIRRVNKMLGHPQFETLLLVSGDGDYAELMENMAENGIRRMLAAPTKDSLSKKLLDLVDNNPQTGDKLIMMLEDV